MSKESIRDIFHHKPLTEEEYIDFATAWYPIIEMERRIRNQMGGTPDTLSLEERKEGCEEERNLLDKQVHDPGLDRRESYLRRSVRGRIHRPSVADRAKKQVLEDASLIDVDPSQLDPALVEAAFSQISIGALRLVKRVRKERAFKLVGKTTEDGRVWVDPLDPNGVKSSKYGRAEEVNRPWSGTLLKGHVSLFQLHTDYVGEVVEWGADDGVGMMISQRPNEVPSPRGTTNAFGQENPDLHGYYVDVLVPKTE